MKHALMHGCAVAAFMAMGLAGPALAAEADASSPQGSVSEVIVTATKRATKLEETPIAITAIDQATVERQRITNFSDVASLTPGLVFTVQSKQEAHPNLRGSGAGNGAAGADLAVSVFIDDVPTTGVGDNDPDLFDLQSIEVLRGPQGTLFGRNVTGGVISVHTLTPSFTPEVKLQGTYGSYNLGEFRGYVTGPLIADQLAGKLSVQFRRQDGYLNDAYLNDKLPSTLLGGGRAQALWTPTADLKVLFGVDYNRDASPYKYVQLLGNFQPSLFPKLSYGPNDSNQGLASKGDARNGGAVIRADYSVHGGGTLTSISGYRMVDDSETFDTTGDPQVQVRNNAYEQDKQITEELHYVSPSEGSLTYIAGVFLLNERRNNESPRDDNIVPGTVVSTKSPYKAIHFSTYKDQHIDVHSYAAFGEANYAFTPDLKLTLGARYTVERKAGHSEVTDTSGLTPPLASGPFSHTWTAFTPKATLSYEPTKHVLAYATISNGFKSGGYDISGSGVAPLKTPFQPETVWNYEAGVKVSTEDNRWILNADVYRADYKNLQVNGFNQALLQYITANAGVANIPGVEVEGFANPTDWLTLGASYAYIGAKYTHYIGTADFSGHQIPYDAKNQFHATGEIHFTSAALGGGTVRLGADTTYQSKMYFSDANNEQPYVVDKTPIKWLTNVHANWTSPDDTWDVSLWAKNVGNERHIVYSTDLTTFFESVAEAASKQPYSIRALNWSQPTMVGLTLTFKH